MHLLVIFNPSTYPSIAETELLNVGLV